ncbi:FAD-binding protein [Chloroflexota bacterium]
MNNKDIDKYDMEADVVVVGYGASGASAAITAHDNGASVIMLEKMSQGGGNGRMTGGGLLTPTSMEAVRHIEALCFGRTEKEIIHTFIAEALKNEEWFSELGGKTEPLVQLGEVLFPFPYHPCWPNLPGVEFVQIRHIVPENDDETPGFAVWKLISTNVERREINVLTNTPAKELITDDSGEITGVIADMQGKEISIKAKRAVILTCGGFEYNEPMKEAYLPLMPTYPAGNMGNTGDGIIMAQKVGAQLHHMYNFEGYLCFKIPEYEAGFAIKIYGPKFIYIDKDGRRFTNETGWEAHEVWKAYMVFRPDRLCYPHLPAYAIFDDVTRRRGPLSFGIGVNLDKYQWSRDNSKEIAKGWIKQGKTIRELARQISVDESTLEETLTKYNEYCKAGKDADFDRSKENLDPIETAPYYAIELWPGLINTQGGPRRDRNARILNTEGKPIPRLYSAGELGSLWGFLYAAGNLTEALVFGRIAGRNAAAERPW